MPGIPNGFGDSTELPGHFLKPNWIEVPEILNLARAPLHWGCNQEKWKN
jgi:hypothetical protein